MLHAVTTLPETGQRVPAARANPSAVFDETSYPVEISAEERIIGIKTKRYFDRTLKRRPPWLIKNGEITVLKPRREPSEQERNPGFPDLPALVSRVIPTDDLVKERISPLLASVSFTFKRIEDKLSDFSGRSFGFFRNIWGINNSYHQWSYEENQHSDALGLVLERTGHLTQQELDDDYLNNLSHTWEPPFRTARQMTLYAAFQEQLTSLNYHALAKRATEEGAPIVAEILKLIAHDEAYHGGGYRAFSRIFAEIDLEGTIEDALLVARNFRMPAQHLMRDLKRNSVEIVRVGAFSKELVQEQTLYKVLSGLGFVPKQLAREAADAYWQ
jgi:rubrerythrin